MTLVSEANRIEDGERGVLVILDQTGDTRHTWDRSNTEEVGIMRDLFDRMIKKGYVAWSVTSKGDKDRKVTEFDPNAEKVIFAPALQGG